MRTYTCKKLPFRDNTHKNRGRNFFPIILLPSQREHPSISLLSPLQKKGDRCGGYPHGVGDVVVRLGERRRRSVFVQLLAGRSPIGAEMHPAVGCPGDAAETDPRRTGAFLMTILVGEQRYYYYYYE